MGRSWTVRELSMVHLWSVRGQSVVSMWGVYEQNVGPAREACHFTLLPRRLTGITVFCLGDKWAISAQDRETTTAALSDGDVGCFKQIFPKYVRHERRSVLDS